MAEPLAATADIANERWRRLVAPPDYRNPEPKPFYHLVVIGAGPAGLVTAIAAAGLGAKVALVERNRMGGDCLNVGCVPSKSLLEVSTRPGIDFQAALGWMRNVRAGLAAHDSVERYMQAGVDVFLGAARFADAATVTVGELALKARRVVIATGARAALPPIDGLAAASPLTNESVFDLTDKPRRLAIVGAGPIGCELAQAFARLEVDVHLLEAGPRILGREYERASAAVRRGLENAGVTVETSVRIDHVERRGSQTVIAIGERTLVTDRLLVAAGRAPNTEDLNLAAVDVQADDRGKIVVDDKLRTTNPRIFAAGDVCTETRFTHHADAHARAVVQNALFLPTARVGSLVVPHCIYTSPEIAQIGPTRDALQAARTPHDVYTVEYADTDRGRTQGDDAGFVQILTAPGSSKILGATIVGDDAGEQIAPVVFAIANGLGIETFGKGVLPYPTRAEALKKIADQFARRRLTPTVRSLLGRWFSWTS